MKIVPALFAFLVALIAGPAVAQLTPCSTPGTVQSQSAIESEIQNCVTNRSALDTMAPATLGNVMRDLGRSSHPGVAGTSLGWVDVTSPAIGMAAGGQDNGLSLSALLTASGPVSSGITYSAAGNGVFFPQSPPGQAYYYFSKSLDWSRAGKITCSGTGAYTGAALIFAAGIDGVRQPSATTSYDGGSSYYSDLVGCNILSLGWGIASGAAMSNGGSSISSVAMVGPFGTIPQTAWGAGDGALIVEDHNLEQNSSGTNGFAAVTTGAYIDSATLSGTWTLNLHTGFVGIVPNLPSGGAYNLGFFVYRLPAALAYGVTTSIGSNSVTVVTGPSIQLEPGDAIWSDAFPLGATIRAVTNSGGVTTSFTVTDQFAQTLSTPTATVNHTSGSGFLWKIPAAFRRMTTGQSHENSFVGWPAGRVMLCSSGQSPALNCDASSDTQNYYADDAVGLWSGGNNTGASQSFGEFFLANPIADIIDGNAIGVGYFGGSTNSQESGASLWGWWGLCPSKSTFVGSYNHNAANPGQYFCSAGGGGFTAPASGGVGPLLIGPTANVPNDAAVITTTNGGALFGNWSARTQGYGQNLTTSVAAASGNVLTFTSVPNWVFPGLAISDQSATTGNGIPSSTTILATTSTTITLSQNVQGTGVGSGDSINIGPLFSVPCIQFQGGLTVATMLFDYKCGAGWSFYHNGSFDAWDYDYAGARQILYGGQQYFGYRDDNLGHIVYPRGLMLDNHSDFTGAGATQGPGSERFIDLGAVSPSATAIADAATAAWSVGDTAVGVTTCTSITAGLSIWDATLGTPQYIGTVNSCSASTACTNVTLTSVTAPCVILAGPTRVASNGAADSLTMTMRRIGDFRFNRGVTSGGTLGWADTGLGTYSLGPPISNSATVPDYTAVAVRTGSSANKDLTGRVTLSGGTGSYSFTETFTSAPNCFVADETTPANAVSVAATNTALTFTGTGTDVIRYACFGRN